MSNVAVGPQGHDPISHLQARIAKLHTEMSRSATMTAIAGIIAMVLLTFYFNYAYNRTVELTKPESVVIYGDQLLIGNLPSIREALQKQIQQSAPDWAGELSNRAVQSVPDMRESLESYVLTQVDQQLADVKLLSDEQFKSLLSEHKDALRKHAKMLATNEKLPEESMQDFVAMYDRHFEMSFKETTDTLFEYLSNMNKNLARLKANQGLTAEEKQQRRLIMLAKAVQGQDGTGGIPALVDAAQEE